MLDRARHRHIILVIGVATHVADVNLLTRAMLVVLLREKQKIVIV